MFKRIKEELFFIVRLFQEGFGPRDFLRYFKNRFLGHWLLKNLESYNCQIDESFEFHTLCQKKDLWMLTASLRSFLVNSGLCPKIIVHDDGSIDSKSKGILEKKFSNLKVIPRPEADNFMLNHPALQGKIHEYRQAGHVLNLKLIDSVVYSQGKKVMICDSDILFFRRPQEIIDFVEGKSNFDAVVAGQSGPYNLKIKKSYLDRYQLLEKRANYVNGGLQVINKDKFTIEKLVEYYENAELNPKNYFVEANGWVSILGQVNFQVLSLDTYIIKGRPNEKTIAKHFTNPRRYELYAYGIDKVRKIV